MKSGAGASKKMLFASLALAAIGLSPAASAQTRVMTAHTETASALKCLLDHNRKGCGYGFVGSASLAAKFWLWPNPNRDFDLGALVSSEYVGTESANAYINKLLNGRPADVYHVKFAHQEKTFYIVPPDPDGKIGYMLIRGGAPADEGRDLFVRGPG
jgi:hypothetical protein